MTLTAEQIEERDRIIEKVKVEIRGIYGNLPSHEDHALAAVENGFMVGFDAGVASERKRAEGLVEALIKLRDGPYETSISFYAEKALAEWESK